MGNLKSKHHGLVGRNEIAEKELRETNDMLRDKRTECSQVSKKLEEREERISNLDVTILHLENQLVLSTASLEASESESVDAQASAAEANTRAHELQATNEQLDRGIPFCPLVISLFPSLPSCAN